MVGLYSIYLSYQQLRSSQRAQEIQTVMQLRDDFFRSDELRTFMYRLDYTTGEQAWTFDKDDFEHTPEERWLDLLLYKLSFIGDLVQQGDIRVADLLWIKAEAKIVLRHEHVLGYLAWLHTSTELPNHTSFAGAVHLHTALFPADVLPKELKAYMDRVQSNKF